MMTSRGLVLMARFPTRKLEEPLVGGQQLSVICSRSMPLAVLMMAMVVTLPAWKGMVF